MNKNEHESIIGAIGWGLLAIGMLGIAICVDNEKSSEITALVAVTALLLGLICVLISWFI